MMLGKPNDAISCRMYGKRKHHIIAKEHRFCEPDTTLTFCSRCEIMQHKGDEIMDHAAIPEWYWRGGLHDAQIIGVDAVVLDYDWTLPNPDRNYLLLRLDASNAMFDVRAKEIRVYNYKVLSTDVALEDLPESWWKWDKLSEENGKYILDIYAEKFRPRRQRLSFRIRFDRAEVIRDITI